ncbi:MAG: 1-phosphofructokinase family hexose kinase [Planctomycetaceae bacterium]
MILSAGLTPAWQRTLVFDRLLPGEVNRATQAVESASGKVLNVGRACRALNASVTTLSVCGGLTGTAMQAEWVRDQISARWVETPAATRTCTTLIDRRTETVTELVENALPLRAEDLGRYLQAFAEEAAAADVVVLTGSLPPQTPTDFYAVLMQKAAGRMILDVRGPELRGALPLHPWLVKPNRAELEQTVGRGVRSETDILSAMRELNQAGAEWVLVTDGPRALWITSLNEQHRILPPQNIETVNPIGCGDCLAAGVAVGLIEGMSVVDAAILGVAAAAENATQLLPARFNRDSVDARREQGNVNSHAHSLPWEST